MNPRGRQFALGGTLTAWTRLDEPTAAQVRLLRRAYAGRELRTFSRYGVRQWAAPLPHTRVIVKDPFALLSLRMVGRLTGALPVVLVRHPAAVLASYRRMGWSPDIDEIVQLGAERPQTDGDVAAMAAFWSYCYDTALEDLAHLNRGVFVEHERLSLDGSTGIVELASWLGLSDTPRGRTHHVDASVPSRPRTSGLHDFERPPAEIANGWRTVVSDAEIQDIEVATAATRERITKTPLMLHDSNTHRAGAGDE
jgi:hypothetical protein